MIDYEREMWECKDIYHDRTEEDSIREDEENARRIEREMECDE